MRLHDDFDRSFKRGRTTVFVIMAVQIAVMVLMAIALGYGLIAAFDGIEQQGGAGKAIGHFIGDVQRGVNESEEATP